MFLKVNVPFLYFRYELLFYPRYHLDQSSLLCRKSLLAKPMVMDVYQDYILVTYKPFDVHIFHVKLIGELTPSGNPEIQVNAYFCCFCSFFLLQNLFFFVFRMSSINLVYHTFLSYNMANSFLQYVNFLS